MCTCVFIAYITVVMPVSYLITIISRNVNLVLLFFFWKLERSMQVVQDVIELFQDYLDTLSRLWRNLQSIFPCLFSIRFNFSVIVDPYFLVELLLYISHYRVRINASKRHFHRCAFNVYVILSIGDECVVFQNKSDGIAIAVWICWASFLYVSHPSSGRLYFLNHVEFRYEDLRHQN